MKFTKLTLAKTLFFYCILLYSQLAFSQLPGWSFIVEDNSSQHKEARVSFNGTNNAPTLDFFDPGFTFNSSEFKHFDTWYTAQDFKSLNFYNDYVTNGNGSCTPIDAIPEKEHQSLFLPSVCNDMTLLNSGQAFTIFEDETCLISASTSPQFSGLLNYYYSSGLKNRFYTFAASLHPNGADFDYYYLENDPTQGTRLKKKVYSGGAFSAATVIGALPPVPGNLLVSGEDAVPGTTLGYIGEMEISSDGKYLAFALTYRSLFTFPYRFRTVFYLFDLTNQTSSQYGNIYVEYDGSNDDALPHLITGLEFNASSDKLYFTMHNASNTIDPTRAVGRFDNISSGLSYTNLYFLPSSVDYRASQIEMGKDNKLYLHHYDGTGLASIDEQNELIVPHAVSFSPYTMPINREFVRVDLSPATADFRIRTMPKQFDGFDYGIFAPQDETCCADHRIYNEYDVDIISHTTWDGSTPAYANSKYYVKNRITVKAGYHLTIENLTLEMGEDAEIIVEPKARLTILNSTLTTHCPDGLWKGIYVHGNSSLPQTPITGQPGFYEQGRLVISGSTLENARTGITTNHETDDTKAGGIVSAYDTRLLNNQNGVSMGEYRYPDMSRFDRCLFEVNRKLNQYIPFFAHAQIVGHNGAQFIGTEFINSDPEAQDYTELGYGIITANSTFTVLPYCYVIGCPTSTPSRFIGLQHGVLALNIFGPATQTFKVNSAIFDGCYRGIESIGINNIEISNNTFNIGNIRTNYPGYCDGVFLGAASFNYKVTENKFIREPHFEEGYTVGVTVAHTGGIDNTIYKNEFTDMTFATLSNGTNRDISGGGTSLSGLQFNCNTYDDQFDYHGFREYDISIVKTDGNSGTRFYWDDYISTTAERWAAGNTFSYNNFNNYSDIYSNVDHPIVYHYWSMLGHEPLYFVPSLVNKVAGNSYEGCPSILKPGKDEMIRLAGEDISGAESDFAAASLQYLYYKDMLAALVDDGNTPVLLGEINTGNQAEQLRNRLLSISPYMSKEALEETAGKTQLLSPAIIFEVLAANPDGIADEAFLKWLEEKAEPLPGWMVEMLRETRGQVSAKTLLMAGMSHYGKEKTALALSLIDYFIETGNEQAASLWLSQLESPESDLALAYGMAAEGNWNDAMDLLAALPTDYRLDANGDGQVLQTRQLSVQNLVSGYLQSGKRVHAFSETEKAGLRQYADNSVYDPAAYLSRALLSLNGEFWRNDPLLPEDAILPKSLHKPVQAGNNMPGISYKVYPNPAVDLVSVEWHIPSLTENAELRLVDMNGKVWFVKPVIAERGIVNWNIEKLPAGNYISTITFRGKTLASRPLIISH